MASPAISSTLSPTFSSPFSPNLHLSLQKLHINDEETLTRFRQAVEAEIPSIKAQQRAANYLSAAMLYLKDNALLEAPLAAEQIKPRLLAHWGACPAINMTYAHVNRLIRSYQDRTFIYVTGPGHGAPAVIANLYLEGSLGHFYPEYDLSLSGLQRLVYRFCMPKGFPSHVNSEYPGQIHEGGELGYALSVAFGSVLDRPNTISVCLVGDGEGETGPTATAWHSYKFLDPRESGAVLPILNVNGYKIAGRTIFGCMHDDELVALFSGYGYEVRIVSCGREREGEEGDVDLDMACSLEWAMERILQIQRDARQKGERKTHSRPRFPLIILRSPKGWTCPARNKEGETLEGTIRAHQVPLKNVAKDKEELSLLSQWLEGYKVEEVINKKDGKPTSLVSRNLPSPERRMGTQIETYAAYIPLSLPSLSPLVSPLSTDSRELTSAMEKVGEYLKEVIKANPHSFRIFCPDEMTSNKLQSVFSVTSRCFQWNPEEENKGGRVVEVLSEHQCQGFMQGYVLTGRHAIFPSYEAFLPIVSTMIQQYAKFVKFAQSTKWRQPLSSLNYIETSTLWRQEHNGFSHQNPMLINVLMNMKSETVRIYLPPDANTMLCTLGHCLASKDYINLIIGSKHPTPVWLTEEQAKRHCVAGASIWHFASSPSSSLSPASSPSSASSSSLSSSVANPDVVLVGCGIEVTYEVIKASEMLRRETNLSVRVVNVTDLMVLCGPERHPHSLSSEAFFSLFGDNTTPVIFNFHGYPSVIKGLLYDRKQSNPSRFTVLGYQEEGTTTTPFRMLTANETSRFHVCIEAVRATIDSKIWRKKGGERREGRETEGERAAGALDAQDLIANWMQKVREHEKYIEKYGEDPEEYGVTVASASWRQEGKKKE